MTTQQKLTSKQSYSLGYKHGVEMANESGSADSGCDGWDGMLINADPRFVREAFGWDGIDSPDSAKELLADYCRGAQAGADESVSVQQVTA